MPQCSYCNRKVAYDAKICPGCGKENPGEGSGCFGIIVIFFVIAFFSNKCSDNSNPSSNSTQNKFTNISTQSNSQSNQNNQSSQWEIER